MWNRTQYLNKKCTQQQYYAQFVTEQTLSVLKNSDKFQEIMADKSEHLSGLSCRDFWDKLPVEYNRAAMEAAGDYLTGAGKVCIYKAAARILQERGNYNA